MCGISGIISLAGKSYDLKDHLIRVNRRIAHRGPDDEGFLFGNGESLFSCYSTDTAEESKNSSLPYSAAFDAHSLKEELSFGFGHRRLSILDLSAAGHQPLSYLDRYWITFNGEIYNYKELKTELEKLGYSFRSASDTEVILASFNKWGIDAFNRFNGMWALMIYDHTKKEFIASRDPYGVKPFYYFRNENWLSFASEQKALLTLPYIVPTVNAAEVFDFFFLNRFEQEEESFFKGIKELKPGHCFTYNSNNREFKIHKYLAEPEFNTARLSEADAIHAVHDSFNKAIELRLRSDVPVGSCLSGGIDSSAIVGTIRKLKPSADLHVFTSSFPNSVFDETSYASEMAKEVNAFSHTVTPTADELIRDLEDLIECQDIPIWSTSTYAQYRVMKLVSDSGIKVILDGQGGDELFAGYHTYYLPYWLNLMKTGNFFELGKELNSFGPGAITLFLRLLVKENVIPSLSSSIQQRLLLSLYPELNYLNSDFIRGNSERLKTKQPVGGNLSKELYSEFYNSRLKGYLKCEDRCAMRFSVESRVPFADDRELINLIFSLPDRYKIRNGVNKYILRKSVEQVVPSRILNRKDKMGYVTPNNEWITSKKDAFKEYFTEDLSPFLDIKKIKKDYDLLFSPKGTIDTGRIFKFIALAVWMKKYF